MRAGSVAGLCDIGVQCELPFQIYGSGLFLLLPFVRCRTVERRVTPRRHSQRAYQVRGRGEDLLRAQEGASGTWARGLRSFKNTDAAGMLQHVSSGGLHTEDSTLSRPRSVSTGEVLRLSEK